MNINAAANRLRSPHQAFRVFDLFYTRQWTALQVAYERDANNCHTMEALNKLEALYKNYMERAEQLYWQRGCE